MTASVSFNTDINAVFCIHIASDVQDRFAVVRVFFPGSFLIDRNSSTFSRIHISVNRDINFPTVVADCHAVSGIAILRIICFFFAGFFTGILILIIIFSNFFFNGEYTEISVNQDRRPAGCVLCNNAIRVVVSGIAAIVIHMGLFTGDGHTAVDLDIKFSAVVQCMHAISPGFDRPGVHFCIMIAVDCVLSDFIVIIIIFIGCMR